MLSDMFIRLRAIFRRRVVERELNEELRFHLERQTEAHIESGLSPQEAVRRARIDLGGLDQVKEECREARGLSLLDTTLRIFVMALAYFIEALVSPWFAF